MLPEKCNQTNPTVVDGERRKAISGKRFFMFRRNTLIGSPPLDIGQEIWYCIFIVKIYKKGRSQILLASNQA
jgi:hypothetical protein